MNEHKLPMLVRVMGGRWLTSTEGVMLEYIESYEQFLVLKVCTKYAAGHDVYGVSASGKHGHIKCGGQLRHLFVHVLLPVEVVSEDEE